MNKRNAMAKIIGVAVVFALIGSMLGGLADTVGATSEKTTIRVIDSSPWFTKGSYSGHPEAWVSYTYSGHTYIYTYAGGMSWLGGSPSEPDCWAEFKPYLSRPGRYDVYACFYADPQNSHQVPHKIYYDGGSTTVDVDQYASSYFIWREVKLGTWDFAAGSGSRVVVTDATGEPYDGYTSLNVDTIKFVKVNQPPECSVSADPRSGKAPLDVIFTLSATDLDGYIAAWLLDVDGDGNEDYWGTGNPPATQPHTYYTPSPPSGYSVILVVGDNNDATAFDIETVVVGENLPPTCSLLASPSSGPAPLTVKFTMSADDLDGWITTWVLDPDDGTPPYSGSGNPPSTLYHIYESGGQYTPILGVSDNDGATAFAFTSITVQPPPAPQVTGVDPPQPVVQPTRQPSSILGSGFVEGAEVTLKAPDGEEWVIPRPENPDINVSPTKIDVNAGFYMPGTWQVWVTNPDSQTSNVFNFDVDIDEDRVDGIDVSHWQGDINWSQVRAAGYEFAFVKATEGVGWTDEKFSINMNGGHGAGMLAGAYHFARPDLGNSGAAEAEWFVSVAGDYMTEGYLRPVLDLEMGDEMDWATLSNWVHDFMSTVKSQTGVEPILYTGWYKNYLDISVAQYDLWIAHWTYDLGLEPDIGIWDNWAFWQYSDQGTISGIVGDVDLDLFNGDMTGLDAFVIGSAQPPQVTTHPATDVTSTSATLHGYLDSLGEPSSSTAMTIEQVSTTTSSKEDQDNHNDIPILQWVDPEGRRPLTYEQYIQTLPPAQQLAVEQIYTTPLSVVEGHTPQSPLVLVIVNSLIRPYIQDSLDQYILDLENEGYSATVCTVDGGTPNELRGVLQGELPNGLVGATLIGELPVPWYEMYDDFEDEWGNPTYSQFPIDLYYMDLDGAWVDSDSNGLFDEHSDGEGTRVPEIWVGRLTANTLAANIEEEAAILQNYFTKNHAYRTGGLVLNERALVYVDDDWIPWADQWSNDVGIAYDTRTLVKDGATTTAIDYMDRLTHNYQLVHIFAHSSPWSHHFKIGDEWTGGIVSNSDIQSIDPVALFYNLFACSNARYVEDNYMGGCYIFADSYGLAAVGSTKTGSMLDLDKFYAPLGQYGSLGESFEEWFTGVGPYDLDDRRWFYGMTLLGDPTLSLQPEIAPPAHTSFEWWTDPAHKNETFSQPMDATGHFSESLTELTPGTTYYFQAKAVADGVVVYGDVLDFLTPAARAITFYTEPITGGTITFDGSTYNNGQSTTRPDDTYSISANPASNYEFDHWTTTGGVSASNANSQSTTVTVSGDGSIKAWFTTSEATVDISVVLQGGSRPPEGWEVPITIKFFSPGADVMTDTPIYEFHLTTTKSDGTAICQCVGVMPGTYDVTAQASNCPECEEGNCTLTNVKRSVVISAPSTAVDMGILLAGDANCDGIINISDFGILAVAYMCTEGEPCYDCRADFDCNGIINISDFGLLAVNYMEMSPVDISG